MGLPSYLSDWFFVTEELVALIAKGFFDSLDFYNLNFLMGGLASFSSSMLWVGLLAWFILGDFILKGPSPSFLEA